MNCSAISAIVALCLLAAPLSAQRLTSNTATVQLTLVIPESAGMSVTLNDNNTATVTVAYNLEKPPMSVGVKYGGQVYEQLCNGEPCTAKNGGALSAQGGGPHHGSAARRGRNGIRDFRACARGGVKMDDFERQARLNKLNAMIERSRERMENAKKAMQALDAALNATSQLEMENAVADMDVAFIIQAVQDSDRPKLATKDLKSIMIQRFLHIFEAAGCGISSCSGH
jgi:hypothetical protein